MKYLITKAEYITGTTKVIHHEHTPSNDIEQTRSELHQMIVCDRVLLTYEEAE